MENGHVEIHDVLTRGSGGGSSEPESPSDAGSTEGSVEFRLIMAYAARRRPAKELESPPQDDANGTAPVRTDPEERSAARRKKKKGWKRLPSILKCVKPQTEEPEASPPEQQLPPAGNKLDAHSKRLHPETPRPPAAETENHDPMAAVASRLTSLVNDIPFVPPDIEADAPEVTGSHSREVEAMIGLLLRKAGDRLNEKELKDANIAAELFWNYSFFRSLVNAVLTRMGLRRADPDAPGPQASPKTQIAVACEITSRLSAVETLPMSRLLDHGARYLQDFYSPWAGQQGGYEAAFQEDEDDEEVQ